MTASTIWMIVAVFALSCVLTWLVRQSALAQGILDHPNSRSSHSVPTPRGGGASFVVAATLGILALWLTGSADSNLVLALVGGGIAVAIVGFMDDRGSLSVSVRIAIHVAAAIWAMYLLGGLPAIRLGDRFIVFGFCADAVATLAIVWALNLFNFMDGIDGLAASEAIFVAGGWAALVYFVGLPASVVPIALLLAASCAGFLCWNWPPAKIFMGDVGSGYLGYVISILAIAAGRESPTALYGWLTLAGVFFIDATTTLLRRLIRHERVYEAHRTHAYQWLSRRWKSHLRVTSLVLSINLFWLLPLAWAGANFPADAWWISIVALSPLVILAFAAGAGRNE
jgi:Fuc2NAc and GlcNAc transferase